MISRTTAKAPNTAMMPTMVGIRAAATLPKMIRLRISTIGIAMVSARAMSSLTWVLTSSKTTYWPATWVSSPAASRSSLTSS